MRQRPRFFGEVSPRRTRRKCREREGKTYFFLSPEVSSDGWKGGAPCPLELPQGPMVFSETPYLLAAQSVHWDGGNA